MKFQRTGEAAPRIASVRAPVCCEEARNKFQVPRAKFQVPRAKFRDEERCELDPEFCTRRVIAEGLQLKGFGEFQKLFVNLGKVAGCGATSEVSTQKKTL